MIDRITPQWLAGFFDGEGCINAFIIKSKSTGNLIWQVAVTLSQSDQILMKTIGSKLGVKTYVQLPRSNHFGGTNFYLRWTGKDSALQFLKMIQPFAIVKLPQIDAAVRFFELKKGCGKYREYTSEILSAKEMYAKQIDFINKENRKIRKVQSEAILQNA
jgi:LAGLIDADG endonuclease